MKRVNQLFNRTAVALGLLLSLCLGHDAHAAVLAEGYSFEPFADQFYVQQQGDGQLGSYGVAVASDGTAYVSSHTDGYVYQFDSSQTGPIHADSGHRLNSDAYAGGIAGLCVSADQRLYLVRLSEGDVVELNRTNGEILRVVASGIRCASHVAEDPQSHDLFVSSVCRNTVYRIESPEGAK